MHNEKPQIVIGTETEYGICADKDKVKIDIKLAAETFVEHMLDACQELYADSFGGSREVIESIEEHSAVELRNFLERPMNPLHRAAELKQLRLQRESHQRRGYTGIMLQNGSRFYRDMSHPELSTPEVTNPHDAIVFQRAGDDIVRLCVKRAEKLFRGVYPKGSICIRKNNSDGKGNSYGGHENYMLSRAFFRKIFEDGERRMFTGEIDTKSLDLITHAVFLFFVARQIVIGAGKVGSETSVETDYQISARSDFFIRPFSLETTHNRGIINLRDAPYANDAHTGRFHVILADSNMSEISLFLKYGTGGLFFMMLNSGFLQQDCKDFFHPLVDPVRSLHAVSRDLTLQKKLEFIDGANLSALEVMQSFAASAHRFTELYDLAPAWKNVVKTLEDALKGLAGNRHKHLISRSLDWVAKERLVRAFCRREKAGPLDNSVRMFAHDYHDIDPDRGIFYKMEKAGEITRVTSQQEVQNACTQAPTDTRAWLRGEIIKRYRESLVYVKWDSIEFGRPHRRFIDIEHPLGGSQDKAGMLFSGNPTLSEFLERLKNASIENVTLWPDPWYSRADTPKDRT